MNIHMCIYIYTYVILYLRPYRYTVFEMHFPDTRERPLSLKCFTIVLTTPQMIFLFCFPKKHYNVGPPSYKLAYRHHQDPSRLFKYRYIYYKHYIYKQICYKHTIDILNIIKHLQISTTNHTQPSCQPAQLPSLGDFRRHPLVPGRDHLDLPRRTRQTEGITPARTVI